MGWRTVAAASAIVMIAPAASGQFRRGRYDGGREVRYAKVEDYDGSFQFCRVVFRQGYGDGGNWSVDFPRADENLSIRLSELTKTPVGQDAGLPRHMLVGLQDHGVVQPAQPVYFFLNPVFHVSPSKNRTTW